MTVLKTIALAFSLFSAIPVPQSEWNDRNLRYVLCAFPLVGAVTGGVCSLWLYVCGALQLPALLQGAGLTLLAVMISGGIHLDGLCDTADALGSHAERDKMIAILKDSHCGASALIACCSWFIGMTAFAAGIEPSAQDMAACVLTFTLSRLLSAFAAVSLAPAAESSFLSALAGAANKRAVRIVCGALALGLSFAASLYAPWYGLAAAAAQGAVSVRYVRLCRRFGGASGDLAGWFVQWAEFASFGAIAAVSAVSAFMTGGIG